MKVISSFPVIAAVTLGELCSVNAATVAQWRFETGPANTPVLHAGADGAFDGTTADVSGNGNSLSAWTQGGYAGFAYRSDVPFDFIPQNGVTNQFSIKNTGGYPAMFTSAAGSSPSGINAETITPAQFTIEASYKPENNGGYRTVVGRDAQNVATANANFAALYLQVRPDDSVRIQFTDVAGYTHEAYSPPGWIYGFDYGTNPEGVGAPWYHLAAVSDGSTLQLYVDNVLVGSTDMTLSGSPNRALAKGSASGTGWTTGAWSVGRGLYAGSHEDRAYGFIDEVRISDSALAPGQFLAAHRPHMGDFTVSGGNLTLNVTRGQPDTTCHVLQSTNLAADAADWTQIATHVFDTNGTFTSIVPIDPSKPQNFFRLEADLPSLPGGALTYSLAGSWPADARERIIYAMDGAVAQYNRYGTFPKHVTANYSPGTPTADGSYSGWINFGANPDYQNYRTALHEISHTLGVGTYGNWTSFIQNGNWTGPNALAQVQAFDGAGATLSADGAHFWPYGLNFNSEASTENNRRHVLMVDALRRDMGIQ